MSLLSAEGRSHTNHLRPQGRSGGATSVSLVDPMKKRYDFSKSVKNPYLRKPKKQLTIRLDEDTIDYFRALAEKNGVPYQNLINLYLRDCAQSDRKLSMKWE
jgi:uncharacterized protein (DUF4415 family)